MTTHNRKLFWITIGVLLLSMILSACAVGAQEDVDLMGTEPAEEAEMEEEREEAESIEEELEYGEVFLDEEEMVEEEAMEEEPFEPIEEFSADAIIEVTPLSGEQNATEADAFTPEQAEAALEDDTTFFEDYGTNPFVRTSEDNLSTFAVDTDSGSYTVARNYLDDGLMPPPDSVRLEEYVNYFEQDYPLPQDDAFAIYTEAAPTPFSTGGSYVMRVGVQGFDVPDNERPDANLVFVVDVSGSMDEPDRLGAVKFSLETLVNELRPNDTVAIVIYGSNGAVLLEPTEVRNQAQIVRAINSLESQGSTNAEEGLRLAYELASANYDEERINRIILCSDGVANVGATGPDAILETVRQQARDGITLTTVGFGMGTFNDVLMEQLANDGDGQYFYVDTPDEARRVFVEDLTGTLQTIARDAKIQVEFNPEVIQYYRLMGYENRDVADSDFRNDQVDAGEIGAGHNVTALYEVIPYDQVSGGVANVYMRWEDPETGTVAEVNQLVTTQDINPSFAAASPRFRQNVAVAAFADILGEGAWAQTASLAGVHEILQDVADEVDDSDVFELLTMVEELR